MNLKIFLIFVLIFLLYIPFSRSPDYFQAKYASAIIQEDNEILKATFSPDKKSIIQVPLNSISSRYKPGMHVKVIYDPMQPQKASIYSFWNYWLKWQDVVLLPLGYLLLFILARAITANPSPEALKELEEERKKPKIRRPRYDV